ncbi:23S rRNA m(2)G-2445 methyltransferase [Kushneria avicenniae]|uniref:Ribosomal RNA large subunit methyltransferase K/L n=1 Tax=Kushneria avicenniae TaxID=402385 RepID=A0A1I1IHW6_9GAMM|nr:bifunctional 23S rRNA (guanine(2069)-N(7))-methyltransferase RlmK/23S rRNA (guanine(2445)-N(2))-methyltransferase RlmL [Kushneria avicenniae]SFC35866.1 23S rRNA m(2)G-2445 methyltransferase [Kushneria avicenniae]
MMPASTEHSSETAHEEHAFLATCPRSMEVLLADELAALGASIERTSVASVHGMATRETLYRLCLWSRLANRIILVAGRFDDVEDAPALTAAANSLAWETMVAPGTSLRVDFHGESDGIRHTRFGAQCVKDGVVDRFQDLGRARPIVDPKTADLRLYAHLHRGRLVLGIDLSGDSLHLRGYRLDGASAPLKENLAAALLVRAGWPARAAKGESLFDPMCGSGTLVIEAALMACDVAPNLKRVRFGFHGWAAHDDTLWQEIHGEAAHRARIGRRDCRLTLCGRDHNRRAVEAARANAERAGMQALVQIEQNDALSEPPAMSTGLVITNPPYGERLGELPALISLYQGLGALLREHFTGWSIALLTGDPKLGHRLGMKAHRQYAFKNGSLDTRLLLIDVHERARPEKAPRETTAESEDTGAVTHSAGAQMFANRLRKNQKRLSKWLKRSGVECYRLYDADMPEYALAIDLYGAWVHVQEYAAPRSIDAGQAERRLMEAVGVLPEVLNVPADHIFLKRRERQSGRSQYERRDSSGQRFQVNEGDARLWVNLRDYLDTGLFLDHRPARRWLKDNADGKRVLNLFCYTATASVQAALGGATESLSIDMSNTYLGWAEDNLRLNRLDMSRHRLVREDCMAWLERAGPQFDLIFMDPPTFSNSKKMDSVLDVQRDHGHMIERAMAHLAPDGTLLFSNNLRRFQMDDSISERFEVKALSKQMLDPDFERRPDIHHVYRIAHRKG